MDKGEEGCPSPTQGKALKEEGSVTTDNTKISYRRQARSDVFHLTKTKAFVNKK